MLKKTKLHFSKLPDVLIIQVARIGKDKSSLDDTEI
jgi:ubiquitin C-terminal hydrolase